MLRILSARGFCRSEQRQWLRGQLRRQLRHPGLQHRLGGGQRRRGGWVCTSPPLPKALRSPPPPPLQARPPRLTALPPPHTEGAESEESSGEADGEAEAWGLADVRELHPGLLAHRAARTRDLPALAAALAHGAEVNWADTEDEGKTPLVQAVLGVRGEGGARDTGAL